MEDQILDKLNDAMMEDKKIKHMNKELQETKQKNKEYDYLINQAENTYGSNLLSMEKLKSAIDEEKFNLAELIKINVEREKQLEKTEADIKRIESNISVKIAKLFNLKKKIEEVNNKKYISLTRINNQICFFYCSCRTLLKEKM